MATVLSVGQCNYDDSRIGQVIRAATGAFLERAHSPEQAKTMLAAKHYELVLVNRVFDAGTGMGVDFIQEINADPALARIPLMLVSDYPDAQATAIKAGALPGFGKSAIASPQTAQALKSAIAPRTAPTPTSQ